MPVTQYVGNIKDTVKSAWEGMSVTLSYMFRRPMTVQYAGPEAAKGLSAPLVQHTLPSRYRGFLEVDMSTCTACQACERACPINVIAIEIEKDPANPKNRVMTRFDIDEAKCMFCGLCVEPCPTGAIQHTREFEGSQRTLHNMVLRFVDPAKPAAPYKPPKGATAYPRVMLGEVTRALVKKWDSMPPPFPIAGAAQLPAKKKDTASSAAAALELAKKAIGADKAKLAVVLEEAQAGTDCGACTYPTCREYSEAIASGKEERLNLCEPGGAESTRATEIIMASWKSGKVVAPTGDGAQPAAPPADAANATPARAAGASAPATPDGAKTG
ncbi:MAG TPA: 4Fe-4S binding protein [Myxococcaceae bacterium]|nr:4Fe-4S binding protein [Myxococcaceae bacterium]